MLRTAFRSITPTLNSTQRVYSYAPKRLYSNTADKVVHVGAGAEYEKLISTPEKLVVVDFTASWCPPCRMIAPKFSEFSKKYDAVFAKVDIDEVNDHPHIQAVSSVPHFKFFKNSKLIKEFSGADIPTLQSTIEANL